MNQPPLLTKTFAIKGLILFLLSSALLFSCTKTTTEKFETESLNEYYPLQVGKYITYRVDSLYFNHFGRTIDTRRYQMKHVVDAQITDNNGRPSYRIYTYLNDSLGKGSWQPNGTYMVTPLANSVELVENNLRFIKLHAPFRDGYTWKGNSYLPTDAYDPLGFKFSNDNGLKGWNYYYDFTSPTFTYRNKTYNDVYTVEQNDLDDNDPLPIVDTSVIYAGANIGREKYAKNIGLVYRQYILWEFQRNPSNPSPFYIGFGTTMWMIDHN